MSYKDYFDFTKNERIGIITLFAILVIIQIMKSVISEYEPEHNQTEYLREIEQFQSLLLQEAKNETGSKNELLNRYDSLSLFTFDPNTADSIQLTQLGLLPYQIKQMLNYRTKGGTFYKKNDLKKIYSIDEQQYALLESFILIEKTNTEKKQNSVTLTPTKFDPNTVSAEELYNMGLNKKVADMLIKYRATGAVFYKKEHLKKLYGITPEIYIKLAPYIVIETTHQNENNKTQPLTELNSATAIELIKLSGIGDKLSSRIIKFKNALGGFHNKKQLKEVYGLSPEIFAKIEKQLIVDNKKIEKININFASLNDLKKHPYLNYTQAKKIIDYRGANGSFDNTKKLKEIICDTVFEKIHPYLCL